MAKLQVVVNRWGGTIWRVPILMLLALFCPSPALAILLLGLLTVSLSLQLLPLLTVPEASRSFRLADQEKWAQAHFFNILAQHKLQASPWKGGWRPFRTAYQAPTLALALRADSGRLQLGLGQPREAERMLRRALQEFPGNAPAQHNLALALHAQGKYRPARAALQEAVRMGYVEPAWELFWKAKLGRLLSMNRLNHLEDRVAFYQSLGFHDIALHCLSLADEDSEKCWRRAQSLLALGRNEQARRETLAELGRHPQNTCAWLSLGFLCALEGQLKEAQAAYRKALAASSPLFPLEPKTVTCKEQLYLLKARTGDRRAVLDALAVLAEYELHPQHQALGKALLLSALGRRQEALEEVAAAGSLARTSTFMELVAYAHLELGQRESGCRLLHRFWVTAEVSRLPMLDRDQRLNRAKETLRSYWRRPSRRDSRKV